jgi:hypothetical protein
MRRVRENMPESLGRDSCRSRSLTTPFKRQPLEGEIHMTTQLLAKLLGAALVLGITMPASFASPSCKPGFQTVQKSASILKCRKTVPMAQKGVALTEAQTAQCQVNSYWNYGPAVTAKHRLANTQVTVRYTCGHVEG